MRQAVPYLIELLDHSSPHALLVPRISGDRSRPRSPQVAKTIRAVVKEAVNRGIAVHVVSGDAVGNSFSRIIGGPANKEDIHIAILDRFPELTAMVPRARVNIWEPEQYYTPLFHAVAMYLAWSDQLSNVEKH